jgi:hypothetical protein
VRPLLPVELGSSELSRPERAPLSARYSNEQHFIAQRDRAGAAAEALCSGFLAALVTTVFFAFAFTPPAKTSKVVSRQDAERLS